MNDPLPMEEKSMSQAVFYQSGVDTEVGDVYDVDGKLFEVVEPLGNERFRLRSVPRRGRELTQTGDIELTQRQLEVYDRVSGL